MALRTTWLIPAAILLLALVARHVDFRPIERLRLALFDEYQRLLPAQYEDAGVRIVDLDDETLSRIGQWPWPRTQVAALVDRLAGLGVAVVAFDVVFAEPDRTSPQRLVHSWFGDTAPRGLVDELAKRLPDHDEVLAKSIVRMPTVLGVVLTPEPTAQPFKAKWGIAQAGDDPRLFLASFPGVITNLPELTEAAKGLGNINTDTDYDGTVRRVPLFYTLRSANGPGEIIPSLSAEAVRVAFGAPNYLFKSSNANKLQAIAGEAYGINSVRIGNRIVPTDANGRVWLHDTGPVAERVVPAWQVMQGETKEEDLKGTIVFIGTSAAGLKDLRALPLDPFAAGVVAHARIAEQIVLDDFLDRPALADQAELLYLLVFGVVLIILMPRWGPFPCAAIAAVGIAGAFGASWFAYARHATLIDPLYPSLAALTLYLASSLLVFLRTESERKRVRDQFGQYLAPALVERLAKDPSQLKLGGETRDMTVLFCDIRDFTSISETMDAAGLIRFINQFLTPMTNIITARHGTIDKYMGDAIMAFWNAPLDDPDHAPNAARASLGMLGELERLNMSWAEEAKAQGKDPRKIAIGVGLNTGACSVGNMGSDLRKSYSVIGDDVNLASRLEGQSKTYGVPIVIGENTRARLGDGFAVLELDLLRVKGKQRPVRVFALLGDDKVAGEVWFRAVGEAQSAMLKSYRAGDWPRASALLALCRRASEGRFETLWKLYEGRIEELRSNALPADWDGVTVARQK